MNPIATLASILPFALAPTVLADDWVIGAVDPDELVVLTTDRVVDGGVILLNRASLTIQGATLTLRGDVHCLNDSSLVGAGGAIRFRQDFAQQHGIVALDDARVELVGTRFLDAGRGHTGAVIDNGSIAFDGVVIEDGFCTWAAFDDGDITLRDCEPAGEFIPFGRGTISIHDSRTLVFWIVLPDGSVVDVALPPPGDVPAFSIGPDSEWASGVPYTFSIEDCSGVVWGAIARSGSSATFRDSTLIAAGSAFENDEAVEVRGLANLARFSDATLEFGDVRYRFVDSSVDAWNFYAFGASRLTLEACVFGELQAYENSAATVVGSICDGRGGYLLATNNATMLLQHSTNLSQTVATDRGVIYAVRSALLGPDTVAEGEAFMVLANTHALYEPRARDAASIFDVAIDPLQAEVGETATIRGSARILAGPGSPLAFDHYTLEHAPADDPDAWTPIGGEHDTPVREAELGLWDTASLDPGGYTLRLSLWHNFGGPVTVAAPAVLLPGPCRADLNADGRLDLFDFLAFQTAFGNDDLAADLNGDGALNVFDFLAFQAFFGAGC